MAIASQQGQIDQVSSIAEELRNDYSSTVYAGQGTLLQANPESGAIVKLSDGTYLWIYLANGEVV